VPIDELVQAYLKSPDEQDRKKAIGALFRAADREAVIALQQIAEIDESLEVRFYARRALAAVKSIRRPKSDDESAISIPDPLDAETFSSFDDEQKCALLKALIDQNRSDSLHCLLAVMPAEQNPRVLATLVMAIGVFGTLLECRVLIPCLSHRDARVRANTIEALEMLGNLKLFAYIFPMLEDPDNRVRANAARSLKSIEPFTSFRLLQAMITSGKIAFQASALYVLRCFESDASAALVAPFLDNPHADLKNKAVQTLRILADRGVERAVELVANLPAPVEEPSPAAMMQELAEQSEAEEDGSLRLQKAFAIEDPRERLEVIEKESVQLGEKAVEPLMSYLERETDQMVVGKIYVLLGRLYDTRAIASLRKGLANEDARCRANAVEAIGMIGEAESLQELIPFLDDPNNRVCGNAMLALRSVTGVDIATPLQRLAESKDEFFQRTAVYVLSELQRVEFFPMLQKLSRAAFPIVRKNANTAITALKKAGYYFPDAKDGAGQGLVASEEGEMVDIIMNMAGRAGTKAKKASVAGHSAPRASISHSAGVSGQSRQNYIAVLAIVIVLVPVLALLGKLAIDYNEELTVRAAAVESALAKSHSSQKSARALDDEIAGAISQAADIQAAFDRESVGAVAAQKKLDKMRVAVKGAVDFVAAVNEVFRSLQKAHLVIEKNCRNLARIVGDARRSISEKPRPFAGVIDTKTIRDELEAFAIVKADLANAETFIARMSTSFQRLQNDLPKAAEIEQEQEKFKKLSEMLPNAARPLAAVDALDASIQNAVDQIGSAEEALVKVSPRDQFLAELAAAKTALFDGRARLQKSRESLVTASEAAVNLTRNGSLPELVEGLNKAAARLQAISKPLTLLPDIPEMLVKSQASMVRTLTILHQKVLAEAVSIGIESDFTTNWDAVVSSETARVALLYGNAHALNGRLSVEEATGFSHVDLIDIDDELQATITIVTNATAYLSNAGAFFDTAIPETDAAVPVQPASATVAAP
jgi:HEAT repeat protein